MSFYVEISLEGWAQQGFINTMHSYMYDRLENY